MKKRMLVSLTVVFSTLLTACGTQQPHINIPTTSDIKRVTVGGGLPGSPAAVLTPAQDANLLIMLKKAKDTGYHEPEIGGYPPALTFQLTDESSISVIPSIDIKKNGNSERGVSVKNYVDWYDSADQSNKPQRIYSPELYAFLSDWRQIIPKSQWHQNG